MSRRITLENITNVHEVYDATDEDLCNFHSFITQQERNNKACADGVFKIIIKPEERIDCPSYILHRLKEDMKQVFRQKFVKCAAASDIHLFRKCAMRKHAKVSFIDEALNLSSFSQETCCSTKLEAEGLEGLLNHFFEDVVKSRCEHAYNVSLKNRKQRLIQEGVSLRETFDAMEMEEIPSYTSQGRCDTECSCPECRADSCLEESDGEEVPQKPVNDSRAIYYGEGITMKNTCEPLFITRKLSLSRLKNILVLSKQHGLTSPNMYVGMQHSSTPLHIADAALWRINYNHFGHSKIWVVIPPHAYLLLTFYLQHSGLPIGNSSCWNCLGHKTVFPSLKWLQDRHIPFKIVEQKQGEAIVVFPYAAHFGFSVGFNVGEAINFATISWLPEGINAPKCHCIEGQIHLDLSELVAAFRPDLLDKYLSKGVIVTSNMCSMASFLHESLKICKFDSVFPMTDKIAISCGNSQEKNEEKQVEIVAAGRSKSGTSVSVVCPAYKCPNTYPLNKKARMIHHVHSRHKPLVVKYDLIKRVHFAYEKAKGAKSSN